MVDATMTATTRCVHTVPASDVALGFAAHVADLVRERLDLLSLPMPNPARLEAANELDAVLVKLCDCRPGGALPVLIDAMRLVSAAYERAVTYDIPEVTHAADLAGAVMFLLLDRMQAVSRLH